MRPLGSFGFSGRPFFGFVPSCVVGTAFALRFLFFLSGAGSAVFVEGGSTVDAADDEEDAGGAAFGGGAEFPQATKSAMNARWRILGA